MFEIRDFSCTLFRYLYMLCISVPWFTLLTLVVPYLLTSHLKPTIFCVAAEICEFQSPASSVIITKISHLLPRNLAYRPYCYYLLSDVKIFFGGGGLGGLQLHKVHTKFRRIRSACCKVETRRRSKQSGCNKTDSLLSLEFLLQGVDVG